MLRRWSALVVVVVATFSVAAATSLGSFLPVTLSGYQDTVTPCTATDVRLLDDVGGTLVDLLTTPLTALSEIDTVRLTGLSGDCDLVGPVVVVGGFDLVGGGGEQVLFVRGLAPLPVGTSGTVDVPLASPIALGDGVLLVLYDLTSASATFCPPAATCP